LAGLRWSDIDLGAGTITVQRARVTDGRTVQEGDTKT
jgi:integrase